MKKLFISLALLLLTQPLMADFLKQPNYDKSALIYKGRDPRSQACKDSQNLLQAIRNRSLPIPAVIEHIFTEQEIYADAMELRSRVRTRPLALHEFKGYYSVIRKDYSFLANSSDEAFNKAKKTIVKCAKLVIKAPTYAKAMSDVKNYIHTAYQPHYYYLEGERLAELVLENLRSLAQGKQCDCAQEKVFRDMLTQHVNRDFTAHKQTEVVRYISNGLKNKLQTVHIETYQAINSDAAEQVKNYFEEALHYF